MGCTRCTLRFFVQNSNSSERKKKSGKVLYMKGILGHEKHCFYKYPEGRMKLTTMIDLMNEYLR